MVNFFYEVLIINCVNFRIVKEILDILIDFRVIKLKNEIYVVL